MPGLKGCSRVSSWKRLLGSCFPGSFAFVRPNISTSKVGRSVSLKRSTGAVVVVGDVDAARRTAALVGLEGEGDALALAGLGGDGEAAVRDVDCQKCGLPLNSA